MLADFLSSNGHFEKAENFHAAIAEKNDWSEDELYH
jgi:hypothetical protein